MGTASRLPPKRNHYVEARAGVSGQDFVPPAKGVFADGRPDDEALALLGKALEAGSPTVRENVVKLLVDMGRSTDPLTPEGADVLRHPRIIGLLAGTGLARPDLGREAAMDALRKLVSSRALAPFGEAFADTLGKAGAGPSGPRASEHAAPVAA